MEGIFKRVTIKDEEYIIQKFDAKTGMKLARLVLSKASAIIPYLSDNDEDKDNEDKDNEDKDNGSMIGVVMAILGDLKDEDIDNLVDKCLRVCYVDLPAGRQPVIDETGHYGVEGVEYDMMLTLMLCWEAIKWGAADFFDENNSISTQFQK